LTTRPSKGERRLHPRRPIRLKVSFRNLRSLVTEYTTSVSKGGCQIQSKQALATGTRFVFEMYATKGDAPVEIGGRVTHCVPGAEPGLYDIGIAYEPSEGKREALERVLDEIFAEHKFEKARAHPRIPVNLIAVDAGQPGRKYLVRDLSRGGMGLRMPGGQVLPPEVKPRSLVVVVVRLEGQPALEIGGEVVWTVQGRVGFTSSAVGVAFVGAGVAQQEAIDALSRLHRPAELVVTFTAL